MVNLLNKLLSISRSYKQLILIIIDSLALIASILISFSIRLGYWFWPSNDIFWVVLGAPIIAIPIFIRFGLYRDIIRFIGFESLWRAGKAVSLYALIWSIVGFLYITSSPYAFIQAIPRSVIVLNGLLALVLIIGLRITGRWFLSLCLDNINSLERLNVVIYGAGSAGRQLSIALTQSTEYNPVAFIDDENDICGQSINGIKIYSKSELISLIDNKNVSEVLLAIPSISRKLRIEIINFLSPYPVLVRSLPGVSELAQGKIQISDLHEISAKDLLGRDSVPANNELLSLNIKDKVVLVTGAGGSIGSELCRQIVLLKPKRLILFEVSESSLYQIEQELSNFDMNDIIISPVIGSIVDDNRMKNIFNYYGVQTIYHAAAYKHVPLVEYNQSQGILNNSIGTLLTAEAAIAAKVETFVLVSTDKAVRPSSTMGASKRVAELVLQALAKTPHTTCLTMVRFGNVLDSSGSVIPLFRKQISQGGPITVTDVNMVRYFMTITEAVQLVIQAGAMGKGGEVFVLDMGEPMKIYDLAVKMIHLSGLKVLDDDNPDGDIEVKFTGLRPGEKLYEELLVGSNIAQTENDLIMRVQEEMIDLETLKPILNELKEASKNTDQEKIRELLIQIVPEFMPQSPIVDLLFDQ